MGKFISGCKLIKADAEIRTGWYIGTKTFHTGVDVDADIVYSICAGVVLQVNSDGKYSTVTVQYDRERIVRYCHLGYVEVNIGDIIVGGQEIGRADKFVHFEYATLYVPTVKPLFPVRVGVVTYYKCDPTNLVTNTVQLFQGGDT